MTIVFAFALTCGLAAAQTPNIQIVPAPRQVTPGEGSFSLTRDTRLILADPQVPPDDQFAAQDFMMTLRRPATFLSRSAKDNPGETS
jgi:hypothetical protein